MKKRKSLVSIAFISVTLASCYIERQGSEHSSSDAESLFSSFSETQESSSSKSYGWRSVPRSRFSDESESSEEQSGHRPSLPLSQDSSSSFNGAHISIAKVYYTVSIYQSYLIPDKGVYGNPRFDTSVEVEGNKPLFSTREEHRWLEDQCRPIYYSAGEVYFVNSFFLDETCQTRVKASFVLNSDVNVYYYCTSY